MQALTPSRLDYKEEADVDVKKYIKEKIIEIQTVKISGDLVCRAWRNVNIQQLRAKELFKEVAKNCIEPLVNAGVFYNRDPFSVRKGQLVAAQSKFNSDTSHTMSDPQKFHIIAQFGTAVSLYHAYALLNNHGLRSFKNFLESFLKKQFNKKVWVFVDPITDDD